MMGSTGHSLYSTKYKVHAKADLGHLSTNATGKGAGKAGTAKKDKISRFEGKQFALPRSDKLFQSFPFTVFGKQDPYCPRNSYRNVPKKLGFGSSEPPKRDEYSNTIAIEQYRETIKSVQKSAAKAAREIAAREGICGGDEAAPASLPDAEEKEESFEYDQAHAIKPDIVGKPRTWNKINLGSLRTTNHNYGADCEQPKRATTFGRTTASAQFFNNNHLRVGDHDQL